MTRRRITPTLGAAAAGLLGAWLAPAAVAFADSFDVNPGSADSVDPAYTVTPIIRVKGNGDRSSKYDRGSSGCERKPSRDISNSTLCRAARTSGTSMATNPRFRIRLRISPVASTRSLGSARWARSARCSTSTLKVPGGSSGVLPDGSVIATSPLAGTAYENVYSAIPSTTPGDPATVTDYLVNTTTNQTINLSGLVNDLGITDATNTTPALPDYITGSGRSNGHRRTGLPPLTIAL